MAKKKSTPPPEFESAEKNWEPIWPFPKPADSNSFVSGSPQGDRIRLRYFLCGKKLVGKVWFGPKSEGPPGYAHGGSMAAVLDEAMGATAWLSKYSVVAAQIKVDFEKMLPIGGVAYLEAGLKKHSGRKVWLEAKLMNSKQEVYSRSVGLFIVLDKKKFAAWLEAPTPKSRPRVKRQRLP